MIRDTWTETKRPKLKEAKIPLRAPIHPLDKNERRADIYVICRLGGPYGEKL